MIGNVIILVVDLSEFNAAHVAKPSDSTPPCLVLTLLVLWAKIQRYRKSVSGLVNNIYRDALVYFCLNLRE